MRARPVSRIAFPLGLVLAALLLAPGLALASSGLPPSVTMQPTSAGPGATVEVTGIDFPGDQVVVLDAVTADGSEDVAVLITAEAGYFRELVTLPGSLPAGGWELRATALDGSTASYAFQATTGAEGLPGTGSTASTAALGGNRANSSDIVVMLIIAILLAALGGGAALAWREVHTDRLQPGMGAGDDPIWSTAGDIGIELTASGDPDWGTLPRQL